MIASRGQKKKRRKRRGEGKQKVWRTETKTGEGSKKRRAPLMSDADAVPILVRGCTRSRFGTPVAEHVGARSYQAANVPCRVHARQLPPGCSPSAAHLQPTSCQVVDTTRMFISSAAMHCHAVAILESTNLILIASVTKSICSCSCSAHGMTPTAAGTQRRSCTSS